MVALSIIEPPRTSQDLKSNGSWTLITQATTLNNPKVLFGVCPAVLFVALLTWLWRSFAPGYGNNPFGTLATWITIQPWLWLIGILKWLKEDPIFPDKPWITTKTPSPCWNPCKIHESHIFFRGAFTATRILRLLTLAEALGASWGMESTSPRVE